MRRPHATPYCTILGVLVALAGCGSPPDSFVERIDNFEMSYIERYVAVEWTEVFWNEDGTIDEFDLMERPVQDDDLIEVAAHPRVRVLKLGQTAITDRGLAHISNMQELVMLGLRGTRITDDGFAHLAGLGQLRSLLVAGTDVTDDGLRHLAGLENLVELGLSETAITDEGLRHLHALPQLALLHVRGCDVSEEAVAALREVHPEIRVFPFDGEESFLETPEE